MYLWCSQVTCYPANQKTRLCFLRIWWNMAVKFNFWTSTMRGPTIRLTYCESHCCVWNKYIYCTVFCCPQHVDGLQCGQQRAEWSKMCQGSLHQSVWKKWPAQLRAFALECFKSDLFVYFVVGLQPITGSNFTVFLYFRKWQLLVCLCVLITFPFSPPFVTAMHGIMNWDDALPQPVANTLSAVICQSGCFRSRSITLHHITTDVGPSAVPEIWVQGHEDFNCWRVAYCACALQGRQNHSENNNNS